MLADQISGLLPSINRKYKLSLKYADIVEWMLPLGTSDIAKEIEEAQRGEGYMLGMQLHRGARRVVERIGRRNRLAVITGRQPATDEMTKRWLAKERIVYDEFINARESGKSVHDLRVLIDDYVGNVKKFLTDTEHVAILVDQPWNRSREELEAAMGSDRLSVVRGLRGIPRIVEAVREKWLESAHGDGG